MFSEGQSLKFEKDRAVELLSEGRPSWISNRNGMVVATWDSIRITRMKNRGLKVEFLFENTPIFYYIANSVADRDTLNLDKMWGECEVKICS